MRLWLRWSWRDLRSRWVQVAAIAFIIALGSGIYSGLSSTSEWRQVSYDASFARLHMYDLHADLAEGAFLDATALVDAARSIPHADAIEAVEPRLVTSTQVDASTNGETILVPGRIVGVDVTDGGPHVNGVSAAKGRPLEASDAGTDVGLLDRHFADYYDLPDTGRIEVSGGTTLDYVGQGLSPEYFLITGERNSLLAEANYAVVFVPLETAQRIAGRPGAANDLVVTLAPGADRSAVRAELEAVFAARFPDVGVELNGPRGDFAYRYLYDDIEGDQRFYNIFAVLILAGAAFAAFNLTGRIVEAQRREIGIGMALGVPARRLAVRPLLVALEVALLGVVFGVGVGLVVAALMGSVLEGFFPLPVWRFPFQLGVFARGAALGLFLPFLATLYPVWRAVRVTPVTAIRTGFLATQSSGLAPALGRIPIPGRTTAQLPFRNVLRAPRRTLMTVLGIAAAITVLVGLVGIIDSFLATIDEADAESSTSSPDRVNVSLDSFYPTDSDEVRAIADAPVTGAAEATLELPSTMRANGTEVETLLEVRDLDSPLWAPTISDRTEATGPGVVITETAADDLAVEPGDRITLRHPRREGATSYRFVDSRVTVIGLNPFPIRNVAFMGLADAGLTNLEGLTNLVVVDPAPGTSVDEVKQALFGQPGVASVQPISAFVDTIRDALEDALAILVVVEGAVLLLALLIAFNSASINADERAREHATMFAFGLRLRTVLRMATTEGAVIGVLGTGVGLGAGWLLLSWLVRSLIPETLPDIGIVTFLAPSTVLTAVGLGVIAVALAPLLTSRKLRRMDIPSTLRVME
ncbi:MAG TPA: FtsX-like permease family protein [Acidimicrobiia bacterium]